MKLRTSRANNSNALDINASRQIVGNAFSDDNSYFRAYFLATPTSEAVLLPALPGALSQTGLDARQCLNDAGQVVGGANDPAYTVMHAIFWANSQSVPVELGALGGDFTSSFAEALNGSGQIVGEAVTSDFSSSRAVYWASSSSAGIDLGALDEELTESDAQSISDAGQIVGGAYNPDDSIRHAVLWADVNSPAVDLNNLIPANSGWLLVEAFSINRLGMISGDGVLDGHTHGFVLVPKRP